VGVLQGHVEAEVPVVGLLAGADGIPVRVLVVHAQVEALTHLAAQVVGDGAADAARVDARAQDVGPGGGALAEVAARDNEAQPLDDLDAAAAEQPVVGPLDELVGVAPRVVEDVLGRRPDQRGLEPEEGRQAGHLPGELDGRDEATGEVLREDPGSAPRDVVVVTQPEAVRVGGVHGQGQEVVLLGLPLEGQPRGVVAQAVLAAGITGHAQPQRTLGEELPRLHLLVERKPGGGVVVDAAAHPVHRVLRLAADVGLGAVLAGLARVLEDVVVRKGEGDGGLVEGLRRGRQGQEDQGRCKESQVKQTHGFHSLTSTPQSRNRHRNGGPAWSSGASRTPSSPAWYHTDRCGAGCPSPSSSTARDRDTPRRGCRR
jgi:hypothetical protein